MPRPPQRYGGGHVVSWFGIVRAVLGEPVVVLESGGRETRKVFFRGHRAEAFRRGELDTITHRGGSTGSYRHNGDQGKSYSLFFLGFPENRHPRKKEGK